MLRQQIKKPVVSVSASVSVNSGESITVTASATDADNDPLSFSWNVDSALVVSGQNSASLVITAPTVTADTQYVATVAVSDGKATVNRDVVVNVIAPTSGGETQHRVLMLSLISALKRAHQQV